MAVRAHDRDDLSPRGWRTRRLAIGARARWTLSAEKVPTGTTERVADVFARMPMPLRGLSLDDVFGDLVRDRRGRATMSVEGKTQRVGVEFGPLYMAAVVYAPAGSCSQSRPARCGATISGSARAGSNGLPADSPANPSRL